MRVLLINGPNLNLLGKRAPEVYGGHTLAELEKRVIAWGAELGAQVEALQSNDESELISAVQGSSHDAILLNPAAFTHTSRGLAEAISSVETPTVEVHISNIREREPWRAHSVIADSCARTIYGRGVAGYRDGLRHLVNRAAAPVETVRYGPHSENVGDLRLGGRGLVVLVHGGFWRHERERDSMEPLAVDLARRGFNTWNIEYRRLGLGGGWPGAFHDTLMALGFVPQLGLDSGRVGVVGHQAGAALAMWAATRADAEVGPVAAMAPVTDLRKHAASGLRGAREAGRLLASGAPPRSDPGRAPTMLVHGADDRHVPPEHSEALASERGLRLLSPETGHFELLDPRRDHWEDVAAALGAPA